MNKSELLAKSPTGIKGLDTITQGGVPKNRTTLICGGPGTGKTLFAMEFLIHAATELNETGVFISFEESPENLALNMASLGFDLQGLIEEKKILIDLVSLQENMPQESGEYDLEGLLIRIDQAIAEIGATRIVLDTVESLFSSLSNPLILRSELRRLFRWLSTRGVTSIVTAELGNGTFTHYGLEEYISDCVISLNNSVSDLTATRRLRIIKYRGSLHEVNEFPFLISEDGIWILPIIDSVSSQAVSNKRVSMVIPEIDNMLSGGCFVGSNILVSGMAGIGKTSFAVHFAIAACKRGERVIYFAFEETENEMIRNMHAIGIDLKPWIKQGLLQIHVCRTTDFGLEKHLILITRATMAFKPHIAIVDSISAFDFGSNLYDVKRMLIRITAFFKNSKITSFITNLVSNDSLSEHARIGVSSLIDTWLLLQYVEEDKNRKRFVYIVKARGIPNSNQIREFMITENGIELCDEKINNPTLKLINKKGPIK